MNHLLPVNFNPISIYWTVLFLVGIIAGVWNFNRARKERNSVYKREESAIVKVQAIYGLLVGIVLFVIQLAGFLIGVVSLYIPPIQTTHLDQVQNTRRIFYSLVVVTGFLLMEHGIVTLTALDLWRRRTVRAMAEEWLKLEEKNARRKDR